MERNIQILSTCMGRFDSFFPQAAGKLRIKFFSHKEYLQSKIAEISF